MVTSFLKTVSVSVLALAIVSCGGQPVDEASTASVYDRAAVEMPIIDWVEQELAAGNDIEFSNGLDAIAADYIKLSLQIGQHDSNFVDAYHGPAIWRTQAEAEKIDKDILTANAKALVQKLASYDVGAENVRAEQLSRSLRALVTRLDVVRGEVVSFDTEVASIFDLEPPRYDVAVFDEVLAEIDALLPGDGTTAERVDAFRASLAIPEDKLQPVFERAIKECRDRTLKHFDLPEGEKFTMEFVTDKPWGGYNYYQGGFESLIQINTDFPIIIDRAVDLGCHEGYPGHHVWNLFVERELVGERGWIEYSVQPLFGPYGPLAEGSGNYGIELAFPGNEKIDFEREVLFPMAGLDPAKASELEALSALTAKLSHSRNDIARRYLDGELSKEEAISLLQRYSLQTEARAQQGLRFIDTYRAYVINYNMGLDLVRTYVEAAGGTPKARWAAFEKMLTGPMTASDLKAELDAR